jgi:hypothetical protein
MFQELSIQRGLSITGTYQVPDYIPKDIEHMERIVTQTFERTRGTVFCNYLTTLKIYFRVIIIFSIFFFFFF